MDPPALNNTTLQHRTSFNRVHSFPFQENQRNQESKGQQQEAEEESSETFKRMYL
jgi:hypothetical protein